MNRKNENYNKPLILDRFKDELRRKGRIFAGIGFSALLLTGCVRGDTTSNNASTLPSPTATEESNNTQSSPDVSSASTSESSTQGRIRPSRSPGASVTPVVELPNVQADGGTTYQMDEMTPSNPSYLPSEVSSGSGDVNTISPVPQSSDRTRVSPPIVSTRYITPVPEESIPQTTSSGDYEVPYTDPASLFVVVEPSESARPVRPPRG